MSRRGVPTTTQTNTDAPWGAGVRLRIHPDPAGGRRALTGGLRAGRVQLSRQPAATAGRGVLVQRRRRSDLVDHAGRLVQEVLSLVEPAGSDGGVELLDGVLDAILAPAVEGVALLVLPDALLGG